MGEERGNRVRGKRQREGEKGHRCAVADRRRLFMIHCKKDCPLKLSARMAWSYLLLRTRHRRTSTRHQIHKYTGLGRKAADAAAMELVSHGLAETTATGRLRAARPADDKAEWFAARQKAKGSWHTLYAYLVLPIPAKECPLTDAQNAVLWCLIDQIAGGRRLNARGVARMVGCDRRTVSQALVRLSELSLLEVTRRPGRRSRTEVTLLEPPEGFADWYRPKKAQEALPEAAVDARPRLEPCLESWVSGLADHGFRDKDMARVRDKLVELEIAGVEPMTHLLDPVLEDAEKGHAVTGKAPCCVNLLLYKIDRWATGRIARQQTGCGPLALVLAKLERQEAEEEAALEHLAGFALLRKLPCPACGQGCPPAVERPVEEERLGPEARALLGKVREALGRNGVVRPQKSRLRCECRPAPWEAYYLQVRLLHPQLSRLIPLPADWEAVPPAGVKPSQPAPPELEKAAHRESDLGVLEDEFLEGLDR